MIPIKKTCERCKALILKNPDGICTLGYLHAEYKPLEECPKPLNEVELIEASKYMNGHSSKHDDGKIPW